MRGVRSLKSRIWQRDMNTQADPLNLFSLQGKRGLILGLANEHSIAWGCARVMHLQGADIIACCLNDKSREYVEPLTQSLGIDLLNCDVEQPEHLAEVIGYIAKKFGTLDFVIHSIAWAPAADLRGRVVDSSSAGFSRAMAISCHSFAAVAKVCAPLMKEGGTMITMSYLGAEEVVPNYGLMGPVKAALESLVRYLSVELGPQSIRVHAVSPGPIMTRAASGLAGFNDILENAKNKSALGRLVTLDEIAQLSAFLCSPAATGMTGQTIFVDAGCHAMA